MTIIRNINKHVCQLGQKLTAQNIQNFGQKVMHSGHVLGRKISNTLQKIENLGNAVIPVTSRSYNGWFWS